MDPAAGRADSAERTLKGFGISPGIVVARVVVRKRCASGATSTMNCSPLSRAAAA